MPYSSYIRPGVYIEHEYRAVLAAFGGLPRGICLVGQASKSKYVFDEVVRRGYVIDETITPAGTSPHQATLAYTCNQLKSDTIVAKDGVAIDGTAWDFDDSTHITIRDFIYSAGAVWTISYQASSGSPPQTDPLSHADTEAIDMVGTYPRVNTYVQGTDYQLTGDTVDWSLAGSEPALDTSYYVSYTYERPEGDFNIPKLAFSLDEVLDDIGGLDGTNLLGIGAQIAFQQNPPFVWYVQVEDANGDGVYTKEDYKTAIDGCKKKEEVTDIVPLMPNGFSDADYDDIAAHLRQHVIDESSQFIKHERLGWFGRKVNTPLGDKSTPYSYVYTATQLLFAVADSPGRGRLILVGPSYCVKTIVMENGQELEMTLDASFIACGIAAKQDSFDNVSDSLLRKTITGFDSIEEWSPEEVDYAASYGVCVVSYKGGLLILLDPITTEPTDIEFQEISAMCQKDLVTARMRDYLDDNIIGIVPDDLNDFVWDIKAAIVIVLKSAISDGIIATYIDENGLTREVDTTKDIEVRRDDTDATKYLFKYWYNLKYPAKRLFGTYTVDAPFTSQKASA
jgi:hypothetical protein